MISFGVRKIVFELFMVVQLQMALKAILRIRETRKKKNHISKWKYLIKKVFFVTRVGARTYHFIWSGVCTHHQNFDIKRIF